MDDRDNLPLDLSLQTKQDTIAAILVDNGANLNATDKDGRPLLHRSILRCTFSQSFKKILGFLSHLDSFP